MCIGAIGGLACCLTSSAASCLCAACPSCRNSTSAKIMYSVFLLLGSIVAMLMCTNDIQEALRKVPLLCKGSKTSGVSEAIIDGITDLEPEDNGMNLHFSTVDCNVALRVYWLWPNGRIRSGLSSMLRHDLFLLAFHADHDYGSEQPRSTSRPSKRLLGHQVYHFRSTYHCFILHPIT